MNPESERRLTVARRLAPLYAAQGARAVIVHGSVARDLADRYSDIEMCAFWDDQPPDEARMSVYREAAGTALHFYSWDEDNGEWSEDYVVGDVRIDMSHRTIAGTEELISDLIKRHDPTLYKQDTASLILSCIPLHGEELIARWRERLAIYPDELARAMVTLYLDFEPPYKLETFAERGEMLPFYRLVVESEKRIWHVLMGLNRIYMPHLGYKWTTQLAARMRHAPPNVAERLKEILLAEP